MVMHGEAVGMLHVRGAAVGARQQYLESIADRIGLALANIRLHERLESLSVRDPLTGLYNRMYMEESMERELLRAQRSGGSLGVIMLDIDHFKRFNDTFGHEAGDDVLRAIGSFLRQSVRGSDIACRYGGEEFLVILPDSDSKTVLQRAEYLRSVVKSLPAPSGSETHIPVTLSCGLAVFPDDGLSSEAVLRAADMALYRAKEGGRDRVCTSQVPL
jgi:diguanylate cyclase (GGDEF)-like protein